MKKKKYLPLYYEWLKTGRLPERDNTSGLCTFLGSDFKHYFPDPNKKTGFWGYDAKEYEDRDEYVAWYDFATKFTPLRQTIVLFMAALNDEL